MPSLRSSRRLRFSAAFSMRARSRCCLAKVVRCFCGLTANHYGRRPARRRIMAPMSLETLTLPTRDGVQLEAERAVPPGSSRASAVLCHPHPQYGGTMRSIVIGALFDALPAVGVTCLRFNFRGVERSTGTHDEGRGELLDVAAAIDHAASA